MRAPGGHLYSTNMASSAMVGGGNTGLTNELSSDAFTSHSSPHEIGNINASAPFQHEPHEDNHPQPEHSAMVMDDVAIGVDLQSEVEALARPSSDVASAIAAIAPSAMKAAGLGIVNDTKAHMHDGEKEGDDTSKGSKKKKEPVFLGRVELVDLNDCDIPGRRL